MTLHEGTWRVVLFPGAPPVASVSEYVEIHGEEWGDFGVPRLRCRQNVDKKGAAGRRQNRLGGWLGPAYQPRDKLDHALASGRGEPDI